MLKNIVLRAEKSKEKITHCTLPTSTTIMLHSPTENIVKSFKIPELGSTIPSILLESPRKLS